MISVVLDALRVLLISDTKWNFDRWVMSCIFLFLNLLWKWYWLRMKCRWNRYPPDSLLPVRYENACFYLFFFFVINNISITHLMRAVHCSLYLSLNFFLDLCYPPAMCAQYRKLMISTKYPKKTQKFYML